MRVAACCCCPNGVGRRDHAGHSSSLAAAAFTPPPPPAPFQLTEVINNAQLIGPCPRAGYTRTHLDERGLPDAQLQPVVCRRHPGGAHGPLGPHRHAPRWWGRECSDEGAGECARGRTQWHGRGTPVALPSRPRLCPPPTLSHGVHCSTCRAGAEAPHFRRPAPARPHPPLFGCTPPPSSSHPSPHKAVIAQEAGGAAVCLRCAALPRRAGHLLTQR